MGLDLLIRNGTVVDGSGDVYLSGSFTLRIDLAVEAFSGGARRLLIAGKGTLAGELRQHARPPVEFLGEVDDSRLRELYRHCRALVFPGREDFGMVPVEAQACGRPVICYGAGGALETVIDGRTGVYFRSQSKEALLDAVRHAESIEWSVAEIRANSQRFSRPIFRARLTEFWRARVERGVGTA
jgi:glycosyltransferase involved in cell wall biosynthesis